MTERTFQAAGIAEESLFGIHRGKQGRFSGRENRRPEELDKDKKR